MGGMQAMRCITRLPRRLIPARERRRACCPPPSPPTPPALYSVAAVSCSTSPLSSTALHLHLPCKLTQHPCVADVARQEVHAGCAAVWQGRQTAGWHLEWGSCCGAAELVAEAHGMLPAGQHMQCIWGRLPIHRCSHIKTRVVAADGLHGSVTTRCQQQACVCPTVTTPTRAAACQASKQMDKRAEHKRTRLRVGPFLLLAIPPQAHPGHPGSVPALPSGARHAKSL